MSKEAYHEMLKPLAWIFGTWKGKAGKGIYPTINSFTYDEEASFHPVGQKPMVEYSMVATKDDGTPLHRESGYIRIKPASNHIAFIISHNIGVSEVQEGEVEGDVITVETTSMTRMSFSKPPEVKKVMRRFELSEGIMEHTMFMETVNTPMTEHLRIIFDKVK